MLKVLTLAAVVALAGCAAQRQRDFDAAAAQCKATIPKMIGNYARRERCLIEGARSAGFSGAAQGLLDATGMELAEKIDAGQITPAEAGTEYARARYNIEEQATADRAQRAEAAAAILGAMPRPQPYVVPAYQIPVAQPWTATCTRMGAFTTCNGS
jgi:hypothetical protein